MIPTIRRKSLARPAPGTKEGNGCASKGTSVTEREPGRPQFREDGARRSPAPAGTAGPGAGEQGGSVDAAGRRSLGDGGSRCGSAEGYQADLADRRGGCCQLGRDRG